MGGTLFAGFIVGFVVGCYVTYKFMSGDKK